VYLSLCVSVKLAESVKYPEYVLVLSNNAIHLPPSVVASIQLRSPRMV